jgi:L-fuconolactonase
MDDEFCDADIHEPRQCCKRRHMSIIDAHQHFWWIAKRKQPLPPLFGDRLARDFTPDDLLPELRAAGIDSTLLVQSLDDYDETLEYLDIADAHDFVAGVVGWVPLADPDECARALDKLNMRPKFVGMRHLIAYEPDPAWVLRANILTSLRMLAQRRLAFEAIPINQQQLDAVIEAAQRVPDLLIVLNHLGRPPVPEHGWEPWASQIARAAACPNISVKLSAGGDLVARWQWSTDELRRYVDHVIERFGPDRVMAASNWPVVLLGGTFAAVWRGITDLIAALSTADRAAVLGGTAQRIYRLGNR